MVSKQEAVHQALQAALDSWNWQPPRQESSSHAQRSGEATPAVSTELSATVFSGEASEWVRYLKLSKEQRYEPGIAVRVHVQPDLKLVVFEPESEDARWLAQLLDQSLRRLRKRLEPRPHVANALSELLFANPSNRKNPITVRLSPDLPSDGTRESALDEATSGGEIRLVLHSRLLRYVDQALENRRHASGEEQLGLCWPVISRVVSALAYPSLLRDRFLAKIDVFAKLTYVAMGVLYDGKKSGHLQPSPAGAVFEKMVSEATQIPRQLLFEQHPYFRMLGKLSFLLRGNPYKSYAEDVHVAAREYLDSVYLRLSLASVMPAIPEAMQAMTFAQKGRKWSTPEPVLGHFGIQDELDLEGWKQVTGPFKDLGFTLLRQLGMGEFGRVYEALNQNNPEFPSRVALKVDRILGKKKHAILEAEEAMSVGRALARAPHLIRLYDTGKLRGERFTYHVLQLIDGDTLDNLVGVTGTEHASVSRPPSARASDREATDEYERAVSQRGGEMWRRQRIALPFRRALSPAMMLDLLTGVLIWLEDVHGIGYAINDLKNGNLMMSRRGQLKGIDLDSYGRVHSPRDKVTDFMFLAVSLVLLLFSAPVANRGRSLPWEELISSEDRLRSGLAEAWPFGDVEAISEGRVSRDELSAVLVDLVHRSRHLTYTKHPDVFTADVARLIGIKRRLLLEELVID